MRCTVAHPPVFQRVGHVEDGGGLETTSYGTCLVHLPIPTYCNRDTNFRCQACPHFGLIKVTIYDFEHVASYYTNHLTIL